MSFNVILRRCFSNSACRHAGARWRLKHGLGKCGNEYGPLTDVPDWSYADGRPAPLTGNRLRRYEEKEAIVKEASRFICEMQEAVTNYNNKEPLPKEIRRKKIYPITSSTEEMKEL